MCHVAITFNMRNKRDKHSSVAILAIGAFVSPVFPPCPKFPDWIRVPTLNKDMMAGPASLPWRGSIMGNLCEFEVFNRMFLCSVIGSCRWLGVYLVTQPKPGWVRLEV